MVKKVICTRVKHASIENIASIVGDLVTFKDGCDWDSILCKSATLEESAKSAGAAGYYVNQLLDLKADITSDKLNELRSPQLFCLTISDGRTLVFGNLNHKFRLKEGSHDGGLKSISFTCDTFDHKL